MRHVLRCAMACSTAARILLSDVLNSTWPVLRSMPGNRLSGTVSMPSTPTEPRSATVGWSVSTSPHRPHAGQAPDRTPSRRAGPLTGRTDAGRRARWASMAEVTSPDAGDAGRWRPGDGCPIGGGVAPVRCAPRGWREVGHGFLERGGVHLLVHDLVCVDHVAVQDLRRPLRRP